MKKIFLIILPALAFLQCTAPKVETGKSNFKETLFKTTTCSQLDQQQTSNFGNPYSNNRIFEIMKIQCESKTPT